MENNLPIWSYSNSFLSTSNTFRTFMLFCGILWHCEVHEEGWTVKLFWHVLGVNTQRCVAPFCFNKLCFFSELSEGSNKKNSTKLHTASHIMGIKGCPSAMPLFPQEIDIKLPHGQSTWRSPSPKGRLIQGVSKPIQGNCAM